jgi:hypothetical protein
VGKVFLSSSCCVWGGGCPFSLFHFLEAARPPLGSWPPLVHKASSGQ